MINVKKKNRRKIINKSNWGNEIKFVPEQVTAPVPAIKLG